MSATPPIRRQGTTRGGAARDELTRLPGVGPSIAADLRSLGVRLIRALARRNPERLYADLCRTTGTRQDPCVLYTFRCAVYAAGAPGPDPELLKWWNWKGRTLDVARRRGSRQGI
jgi:hypothetical protein